MDVCGKKSLTFPGEGIYREKQNENDYSMHKQQENRSIQRRREWISNSQWTKKKGAQ